jgi:hypothetical protein
MTDEHDSTQLKHALDFCLEYWKHLLMQHAVRRSIPILALLIPLACGPGLAYAQSGSAGGSIGNDEKSLSGSRAGESSKPARRSQPEADEPRHAGRKSGGGNNFDGAWIVSGVGVTCQGTSSNAVVGHQRQDYRADRPRHRQSRWQGVRHLHRQWHHGHHRRPAVRPQRRRNVPAVRRLHRKVDRIEAIAVAHRKREILEQVIMEYSARRSIRIILHALLISVAISGAAVAQSGSAGGSIGNDEKSLSGSREKPRAVESSRPARRAKSESDERASRKSSGGGGGGNFDGSWVAVAVGTPCGSSSERFVISGGRVSGELSSGSVSPNGSTRTGGSVQGLSWNSTGRFSGRTGSGSFVRSDGCTGRWTASKQ